FADRLRGGGDVVLVERGGERGPAVAGCPERHPLGGIARVGVHREVGGDQLRDIDEVAGCGGLARARAGHAPPPPGGPALAPRPPPSSLGPPARAGAATTGPRAR